MADDLFYGAVSLEHIDGGIKPWRIPYRDLALFLPNGIDSKAEICAGVRLRLRTDSTSVIIMFAPLEEAARMDCTVDGALHSTVALLKGDSAAPFTMLPGEMADLEIFLPQNTGMTIIGLRVMSCAEFAFFPDQRPKWVTYGSSITQCVDARSPSYTWPAIASRRSQFNLTCLGFSGNCHLEPTVARMIRDLPADFISLCVGINVYGAATLSPRTFKPALIGMLETIREKHSHTPLLVISPIYAPDRETTENKLGFTLIAMREEISQTVALMQNRGDRRIFYLDGLELLGLADADHLPDGLHPDASGYELMADRFVDRGINALRDKGIFL
ncbi:SGNH/GDSL hydrolase family protein [Cohnella luojiensis]|uniref:SGNH/GDSL hydrolase family protein n=1 Tax=Cohnella luojiensis TaxID=652876 RepID=UPI001F10DEA8|nr:SGNH/GDSL hydrolase family protein [Cohnella luojiensis]